MGLLLRLLFEPVVLIRLSISHLNGKLGQNFVSVKVTALPVLRKPKNMEKQLPKHHNNLFLSVEPVSG